MVSNELVAENHAWLANREDAMGVRYVMHEYTDAYSVFQIQRQWGIIRQASHTSGASASVSICACVELIYVLLSTAVDPGSGSNSQSLSRT